MASVWICIGSLLLVFPLRSFFLIGSCLYCILLPFVFTRLLDAHLLFVSKVTDFHWSKAVSLSVGGGFFVFLHFFNMSFKLDIFTSYFIGRFNFIIYLQAGALIFSYVTAEMVITVENMSTSVTSKTMFYKRQSITKISFVLVCLICAIVTTITTPPLVPTCRSPNNLTNIEASNSSLRVIVLNTNYLHDMYGKDNTGCVTDTIEKLKPDFVHLSNSNAVLTYFGGKDLIGHLKKLNVLPLSKTSKTFTPNLYFGTSESFSYYTKLEEQVLRNDSYLITHKIFKNNKTLSFIIYKSFYNKKANSDNSLLESTDELSANSTKSLIIFNKSKNASRKNYFSNLTNIQNLPTFLNSNTSTSSESIQGLNGLNVFYRNLNLSQVQYQKLVDTKEKLVVADFDF